MRNVNVFFIFSNFYIYYVNNMCKIAKSADAHRLSGRLCSQTKRQSCCRFNLCLLNLRVFLVKTYCLCVTPSRIGNTLLSHVTIIYDKLNRIIAKRVKMSYNIFGIMEASKSDSKMIAKVRITYAFSVI